MPFDSIKKRLLISLFIVTIIVVGMAFVIFATPHENTKHIIFSQTITFIVLPFLTIQVSPPGYPSVGGIWTVNVYIANSTENGVPIYKPLPNATINIMVKSNSHQNRYELRTDNNGEASFQYLAQGADYAFQANYTTSAHLKLSSPNMVISSGYVSSETVDTLLIFNVPLMAGSFASDLFMRTKVRGKLAKLGVLTRWIIICVVFAFTFVFLICVYSKLFQSTVWGYPESILGNFVTFTSLDYIFYIGLVLFSVSWFIRLIILASQKPKEPRMSIGNVG